MAATTFAALKAKNDPLVISALDWAVMLHPWAAGCSYMPTAITDSSGVLQALPSGWVSAGEIQQKAGADLTPDIKTSEIDGYGSGPARRIIPTSEGFQVDYTAQEWTATNLGMYHNMDLSSVATAPGVGFRARKSAQLSVRYWSVLLIGFDGSPGQEIYPWFAYGKMTASKRNKMSGQQGSELGMPMTLSMLYDNVWGDAYDFGVAGVGWDAIAPGAGFGPTPTSITVSPSTATMTAGQQIQLVVLDNNGFDRTSACAFVSGTPAKATVTTGGRITAVASGTSTITATYGALTPATCAVTVS